VEISEGKAIENQYVTASGENPAIKNLMNGGSTLEDIVLGLETGDISNLKKSDGQPFTPDEQQKALEQGREDVRASYEMTQKKAANDLENKLAQSQDDYQNFLLGEGDKFREDKSSLDKNAADSGMLFSGSRAQKQKQLENSYKENQAYAERTQARNIDSTALDYQSIYGDEAARNPSLSQYYSTKGGNTFNAGVARNGVGTSGISSIYNTGTGYGLGTAGRQKETDANLRAANYLKNRSNKTLSTGYNNQL